MTEPPLGDNDSTPAATGPASDIVDSQRDAIIEALRAGHKIGAIKLYREASGAGLAEAKRFVEQLQSRLREQNPDEFPAPNSGCATVVLSVLVVGLFLLLGA